MTAVSTEWTRAVLGVPGMNYSTLLQRSSDFATYELILDPAYPDELDRIVVLPLLQMLWDRAEADGYAEHMTDDPYPGTPKHAGAHARRVRRPPGRERDGGRRGAHDRRAHPAARARARSQPRRRPVLGHPRGADAAVVGLGDGHLGQRQPAAPPLGNVAPTEPAFGEDPHENPRRTPAAQLQKSEFLQTGRRGGRHVLGRSLPRARVAASEFHVTSGACASPRSSSPPPRTRRGTSRPRRRWCSPRPTPVPSSSRCRSCSTAGGARASCGSRRAARRTDHHLGRAVLARDRGVWLLAGSITERIEGAERHANTSCLIAPDGEVVATYRKIHLFDVNVEGFAYQESATVVPGEEIVVADAGPLRIGMSICYDLRFPEEFRIQALRGATVVTLPSAFTAPTGKDHWEPLLRARAIENQVFVDRARPARREHAEAPLARAVDDRRPVGRRARAGARHASASSPQTSTSTRSRTCAPASRASPTADRRPTTGRRNVDRSPDLVRVRPGTRRGRARAAGRGARLRAGLAVRLAGALPGRLGRARPRRRAHRADRPRPGRARSRPPPPADPGERDRDARVARAGPRGRGDRHRVHGPDGPRPAGAAVGRDPHLHRAGPRPARGRGDGGRRSGREDDPAGGVPARPADLGADPRRGQRAEGLRGRARAGRRRDDDLREHPEFEWCALLSFGTVLDPGEAPDSPRVYDAAGPALTVVYHGMYETDPELVESLPGGPEWRAAIEKVPPHSVTSHCTRTTSSR